MGARLFCKTGKLNGSQFDVGERVTIGRHSDNQIVLSSAAISEKQACIQFDSGRRCYFLENLGSKSGTQLDGVTVEKKVRLDDLHVITFGEEYDFIFRWTVQASPQPDEALAPTVGTIAAKVEKITVPSFLDRLAQSPQEQGEEPPSVAKTLYAKLKRVAVPSFLARSAPASRTLVTKAQEISLPSSLKNVESHSQEPQLSRPDQKKKKEPVLILNLPEGTREFSLAEGEHTVGRSQDCEIQVNNNSLSRRHAVLIVRKDIVAVKDLDSVNHTFVEDQKVTAETELRPGNSIRFGRIDGKVVIK